MRRGKTLCEIFGKRMRPRRYSPPALHGFPLRKVSHWGYTTGTILEPRHLVLTLECGHRIHCDPGSHKERDRKRTRCGQCPKAA